MATAGLQSPVPKLALRLPASFLGALILGLLSITLVFGAAPQGCGGGGIGDLSSQVPRRLAPIYVEATSSYRLGPKGPAILASINEVETDFGQLNTVSSAGAEGWMQFMPETWAAYGVDANKDGRKDPFDPEDAIFAAANYLKTSGAPGDWREAIFAYNHADWYVDDVLKGAQRLAGDGDSAVVVADATVCEAAPAGPAVQKMIAEADRLDALHLPYVYGGSHGESPTPANGPFDCSSAVSHLLQVAGFGNPTMDTTALIGWGEPGPGRWVTIHVKPYGSDAHTFIEFHGDVTRSRRRYWGTSSTNQPGGGPGWIHEDTFSANYMAGFQPRHPPGL
ncbi:MAG TPA: lytic transglycosylase domain-containing protein [Solirubrobacterales bacterium]|nr:lytic transglycosylase domain-containing protein [Solirubrobacterales bacterium]